MTKLTLDDLAVLSCLVEDHYIRMLTMPEWKGKKRAMINFHTLEKKLDKMYEELQNIIG